MHVLLILFGAVAGAGASESALFGAVLGGFVGWLVARQSTLAAELAALRQQLAASPLTVGDRPRQAAAAPEPAVAIEPEPDLPAAAAAVGVAATPPAEPAAAAAGGRPSSTPAAEPASQPQPAPEPESSRGGGWATAPADQPPTVFDRLAGMLKRWFTEGNVPVKVGMLVLFVGVAALLKYAVDQGVFSLPIEVRLGAIATAAIAALAFGWRQRAGRPVFALALQGGALGVLLLTVFAGYALWQVVPVGLAFGLVLVLIAGSAALALLQHALALAVLGSVGGFLAPVLISTGSGNHVALFSYYALLNLAIFAIAWVRPWRVLNLVGFVFTFAIGSLWGWRYYQPQHFATTEPFLLLFFGFYVAIAVLYALRQPGARRGLVDGTLVFGTPLLGFALQAALLKDDTMSLAWSALVVATLYGVLAATLIRRDGLRTLALSFAALAVGFATLAVPLALSASWTAATWALEGAALLWLGLRQQQRLSVASGLVLQVAAGAAWLASDGWRYGNDLSPVFGNGRYLGGLLLAGTALFSSCLLERSGRWPRAAWAAYLVGFGWWSVSGLVEIDRLDDRSGALLGWLAVGMLLFGGLRIRLPWPRLGWALLASIGVGTLLALAEFGAGRTVLHDTAAWSWPLWFVAAGFALHALRQPQARGISIGHVLVLATLAMVASIELHARVRDLLGIAGGWSLTGSMLPFAALLWGSWRHPAWFAFPLADRFGGYRRRWFVPASAALALWWILALGRSGDPTPLPFVPLLNPLELGQLGVLVLLFALWREHADDEQRRWLPAVTAAAGFVGISAATLRTVHHWAGIGWSDALWRSMLGQTSLTVVWSVLGVGAWIIGSKRGSRSVWLAGALLMAVVLAKLVLIDRSHMGNIPGIVSFLAVGLLLTVVGYLAPSPPRMLQPETSR